MFENNRKAEIALYYLYMMADGELAYSEEKIFDILCNEMNTNDDEKELVIEECKRLVKEKSDVFSILIREKIDEKAGQSRYGLKNASSLAQIIWNLVYLGYADSIYSGEEKKIVSYLVDKWSVSSEVYQEFVDIAETMLALSDQKKWIASTFSKGVVRDKKEKEVDSEINQLLDDVKLTLEELLM